MDIEQEVNKIIRHGAVQGYSKEILAGALSRLPETTGIIVIELRGNDDATIRHSCSLPRSIYELHMAAQILTNIRLGVNDDPDDLEEMIT